MAGASKRPESFDEGLVSLYQDVSALALAPDVNPQGMQFIQIVQKAILQFRQAEQQQKARQAAMMGQQAAGVGGQPGQGGQPGMGGPPGGGAPGGQPGGAPGQPNQIQPGGGAGMSGYGGVVNNPDELQRILAGTGGMGNAT